MTRLPEQFVLKMKKLLELAGYEDQLQLFIDGYEESPRRGLRFNSLRIKDQNDLLDLLDKVFANESGLDARSNLTQVSWSDDGYHYDDKLAVGRSLANRLGLYYIQEPSAMLPAQALGTQPGERVIDLCAAPGGKSARIAADLAGDGLLVANDISSSRGRILVRNLEQLGVSNCLVTAADPLDLAKRWGGRFDRVLVDAPCSGEGMFRRDPKAIASWADFGPESIIPIQRDILDAAHTLLRPGGVIVYSTCTFNRQENEEQIEELLKRRSDLELMDIHTYLPKDAAIDSGISDPQSAYSMDPTGRIWPWRSRGEGHFCALIKKKDIEKEASGRNQPLSTKRFRRKISLADRELVNAFFQDMMTEESWTFMSAALESRLQLDHGKVHLVPDHDLDLEGIHILKEGIYLGNVIEGKRENRFEAAHSMVLTMPADSFKPERSIGLDSRDQRVVKILKGDTIELNEEELARVKEAAGSSSRGYLAVRVDACPLSWLKLDRSGILKNLYPAGWRMQ